MASFGTDRPAYGNLEIEVDASGRRLIAYYKPTELARRLAPNNPRLDDRLKMIEVDADASRATIYPLNTLAGSPLFLEPRYDQLVSFDVPIQVNDLPTDSAALEELMPGLPRGFIKDFQYGLGIQKDYRALVDSIEANTPATELIIGGGRALGLVGSSFALPEAAYEEIRAELDRIASRARIASSRIKKAHVFNTLAVVFDSEPITISRGRHPITQLISDEISGELTMDSHEQDQLIDVAIVESRRLAESRPETLAKLRSDIDLVALETLIEKYEAAMLANKTEPYWQAFFTSNPFALHLAFGYSIVQVKDQASVGGRTLTGVGDKVTDFLVKNPLTNNLGIFEIKKPATKLLTGTPYRGGVFGPSKELAGSVNQVLDQRYQLQKSLIALKDSTRDYELEQYSIGCCLIIGLTPDEPDMQKSFELFRHGLKDVDVITYDELLAKLKQLQTFLG